jgi:Ras-related protein Rab-18
VKVLLGNKIDQERTVQRKEAEAWANDHGMLFMESSAKTKQGIDQVFQELVQKILETPDLLTNTTPSKSRSGKTRSSGCC